MIEDETSKPWYKHLWPWLVMLPPLASVIGGIITVIIAGGPPEMVDQQAANPTAVMIPDTARDGTGGSD